MFIGKAKGFGQKFDPPEPSLYLKSLLPHCKDVQRSSVTLSLIRSDIKENDNNKYATRPDCPILDEAIRHTARKFQLPERVPLIHLNDIFCEDLPIWSSSPGLPWTQLGYKTKAAIRDDPDAVNRVRWFWHRIKLGEHLSFPDCCAYVRSHLCKEGEAKVRAVWGYPATITFGEAVFALPLIRAYQKGGTPIAYGFESGTGGMKKIFQSFKGRNFLGIDFSKFDKNLPAWLIETAFDILARNLDFGKYKDRGIPVASSVLRMFNFVKRYCIHTKIRICNGERYLKSSGLASGSYFTQLVGSICNHVLLTYAAMKRDVTVTNLLVFGDDSIMGTEEVFTPDDIEEILNPLGIIVNVEKSGYSKYISRLSFLGYRISDGYPQKDRHKQAASLVWPERNDKDWNSVASRALGLLYANLGVDPVIDNWCREIVGFKPFDLILTRDQNRFLKLLGFNVQNTEPPTSYDFLMRLGMI